MTLSVDTWLSEVVGVPCFVASTSPTGGPPATTVLGSPAFFSARTDVKNLSQLDDLLRRGFRLIDTALVFHLEIERFHVAVRAPRPGRLTIDAVLPSEVELVAAIAGSTFQWSRFHMDPDFPNFLADRVKREWGRNLACGKRGTGCLVAREHGRIVAFLGYELAAERRVATIDLVGVHPRAQGSGIGTALVGAFVAMARERDCDAIVGTQASNYASVRVYEGLGFRLMSAQYVLHGHSSAGSFM